MPWAPNSLQSIALQKAGSFLHLPNSARPGVVCVLRIGNRDFTGQSSSQDRDMHPDVEQIYNEIPDVYRGVNNGRCAEADALSKALYGGINRIALRDAECQAVNVNKSALVPPCQSCTQILRRLSIRYIGDVDFNPVLAEIAASGPRE